jgi:glycolate oxidase
VIGGEDVSYMSVFDEGVFMANTGSSEIVPIAKELAKIVPEKYVITHLFERIKSSIDTFPYEAEEKSLPFAIVMPKSKNEVSEIMKYANRIGVPVFIRGSGTSFTGASRYPAPGIVINTHRMDNIEIFEDYGFFECGPGCICESVAKEIETRGYFLPFAPGSRLIASMGGLIANNTSAHVVDASIGKPGDYVLGLEVVLPNGEIIETGTKGLRRPAGTDLTKLFVGGDGLFGVVTKIRMRLAPAFEKAYGIAIYQDLRSLAKGVQRIYMERRPPPLFMEFMEKETAKIGYKIKGLEIPKGSVILFVSIGNSREEASHKAKQILSSLAAENPIETQPIEDIELWEKLWSSREVIGSYLMQESGNQWASAEVVSNLRKLEECMEDARHFNKDLPVLSQLALYLFGHIGGLTMHPGVIIPKEWDNEKKKRAIDEKFQREAELNLKYNTCGGEWGQFAKRTPFFIQRYGRESYEWVMRMKKTFDPNNILNRGVLEGNT